MVALDLILSVSMITTALGDVTEFERDATGWLAAVSGGDEAQAFDQTYPGLPSGSGCLVSPPQSPAVIQLSVGTLTVSAFDEAGHPTCAVVDGSMLFGKVSDGKLIGLAGAGKFVLEFRPPVSAFYTFYGSLAVGSQVSMWLFENGQLVERLVGPFSEDEVLAVGHGFISELPIDRIELTSTENGVTLVGAFVGLAPGEPSLGTVTIPGYGTNVQLDFACVLVPCALADINGDGVVDVLDLLVLLAQWGPCPPQCFGDINGDGVVDVLDLLELLANWGPCM